jgi:hypothetical protein
MNLTNRGREYTPVSQGADSTGKTRLLIYPDFTLVCPPLPSFNLPSRENVTFATDINKVVKILEENNMVITSQVRDDKKLYGIWVRGNVLPYGYIPLNVDNLMSLPPVLKNIKIQSNNPISRKEKSYLNEMDKNKKISTVLKAYTLFLYSSNFPEKFDKNNFIVDKQVYDSNDIDNIKTLSLDSAVVRGNKLIVPPDNANIVDRLLYYLQVCLLNDRHSVENYKDNINIDVYSTVKDFRSNPGQVIFSSVETAIQWLDKSSTKTEIYTIPNPDTVDPYYYRNHRIAKGYPVILQNVAGKSHDEKVINAIKTGKVWLDTKINPGNAIDEKQLNTVNISNVKYYICDEDGCDMLIPDKNSVHLFRYYNRDIAVILYV